MNELRNIILDLYDGGIVPPYQLTIGDDDGREVAFDVSLNFGPAIDVMEGEEIEVEVEYDIGGEG